MINNVKQRIQQLYEKPTLRIIKMQIAYIIILIFSLITPIYFFNSESTLLLISWLGNITFGISLCLYYKLTKTFISPYIFFYVSFYLFQFGQLLLFSFRINYDYVFTGFYSTYWENDINIVIQGAKIIVLSLAFFNLGSILSFHKKSIRNINFIPNKKVSEMKIVGIFLFIVSIIPFFYNKIGEVFVSIKYGYQGLYNNNFDFTPMLKQLTILFIPSCILLMIVCNNKTSKYIQLLLVIVGLLGLVGGGRTEAIGIFSMLIIYNYAKKVEISIRLIFKLVLLSIIFMILISSFSEFRLIADKSIIKFLDVLIYNTIENNVLFKLVGELGWSMGTVFMTIYVVPKQINFGWGSSYLASLSRFIPTSIDPSGIIARLHEISYYPSNLLTNYYQAEFGLDTTLIAESYFNFGVLGVCFMIVIGYFIGKLLGYKQCYNIFNNKFSLYVKLVGSFTLFTLPRRHFGYMINQIAYTIVYVYLLVIIVVIVKKYFVNKNITNKK